MFKILVINTIISLQGVGVDSVVLDATFNSKQDCERVATSISVTKERREAKFNRKSGIGTLRIEAICFKAD